MKFCILERNEKKIGNSICLEIDRWDDNSFKTMFYLTYCDGNGDAHGIGNVKIGFQNQPEISRTYLEIDKFLGSRIFEKLPENFFSLGTDVEYYKNLWELPNEVKFFILDNLNDVVRKIELFDKFEKEPVMQYSLLRSVSETTVRGQFARILRGESELTNFHFFFRRSETDNLGEINLEFNVLSETNPKPSTNIHAIIGRNGVGKTTLLNGMIKSYLNISSELGDFLVPDYSSIFEKKFNKISNDYFSHLVAVSFSVFDPFIPKSDDDDKNYFYIGLKKNDSELKNADEYFENDFITSWSEYILPYAEKKSRWLKAITNLESDDNFAYMNLSGLINLNKDEIIKILKSMSSGHLSVLLIITQLVAKVEEKTLVLLDEPESHLHPPLLSAFIRALSELLDNRNGVAIIATHSPVVLQEIPKSCVWKIVRTGKTTQAFRLPDETFGENVGVLTREVFGLEVEKSGFHKLLSDSVNQGYTYDEILARYNGQLGREGKLLLKTLIRLRDEKEVF